MTCCLNPDCLHPQNPDDSQFCHQCGTPLVLLLRNRFKILKPIGRGGFGKTYLAEDHEKLNQPCVVKQLAYQGYSSASTLEKVQELFEREAWQLQKLGEHPQIPSLLAYFEEKPYLYLVQQYIEGHTLLAELQDQGPFSDHKIQGMLADILPVLQFVHQNGIVHRDLKPENIIRRQEDRRLVLIDFGVSKVLSTNVVPRPGTMLGSQGYAPLEQILEGQASPASDLFSLGATCFHLLSGLSPHERWSEAGYHWTETWQTYLPSGFQPKTIHILDRLLQADLQKRYQTTSQVLQDLLEPSGSPAPPTTVTNPSVTAKSIENGAKLPLWSIGFGAVILSVVIGVPWVWTLTHSNSRLGKTDSQSQSDQPSDGSTSGNHLDQVQVVQLPAPNFKRSPTEVSTPVKLDVERVSAQPNQITDEIAWFQRHQISLPTYEVPNPLRNIPGNVPPGVQSNIGGRVLVQAIKGDTTLFLTYGSDYSGGTILYGFDEASQTYQYGFDFSNFEYAPENNPADLEFVSQRIIWVQQNDQTLYVSHGHRTYAASSKGMNAYITAIDLKTQNILWTSPPLVSNSSNFQVLGEMIVTGYGFTDEPDFLYLLDQETGLIVKEIPLETSPEFIVRQGDRLLVRGYDTDYEFRKVCCDPKRPNRRNQLNSDVR